MKLHITSTGFLRILIAAGYLLKCRKRTATNEDLQKTVTEKRFREDLLYRLKEFTITTLARLSRGHIAVGGVFPLIVKQRFS